MLSKPIKSCLLLSSLMAFQAEASTDVVIADLEVKNNKGHLSNINNISQRPGYDNQPYFAPDDSGVYYTAMFQINAKQAQSDILFHSFSGGTQNVTQTWTTSEYSPTPYKGGRHLSMIKVEEDGTQRLWSVSVRSKEQSILNGAIMPVGYHAWGKDQDLALFVLGEPMTLQYVKILTQNKGKVVAEHIGRSIRYNAKLNAFSFTYGQEHMLALYRPESDQKESLISLPKGSEYYTWLDQDRVLSAQGNKIMVLSYSNLDQGWYPFADISEACTTKVTRLAVNQAQTRIALVCDEHN